MRYFGKRPAGNITRKDLFFMVMAFLILISIVYFSKYRKEKLLLNNKETIAIVKEKYSVYLSGKKLIVEFKLEKKQSNQEKSTITNVIGV